MGGASWYKLVVYMLLSAKGRAYFGQSIAIEMGGVSRYFSEISGSGVDVTLLNKQDYLSDSNSVDSSSLSLSRPSACLHVSAFPNPTSGLTRCPDKIAYVHVWFSASASWSSSGVYSVVSKPWLKISNQAEVKMRIQTGEHGAKVRSIDVEWAFKPCKRG